jgi:hypothetical protein
MTDNPESRENELEERDTAADSGEAVPELPKADFSAHIYTLAMQAMIFLGKQPNPENGKYERRIEVAKYQIDTLEILRDKTKGNLEPAEQNLMETLLHQLRLAHIDESEKKD